MTESLLTYVYGCTSAWKRVKVAALNKLFNPKSLFMRSYILDLQVLLFLLISISCKLIFFLLFLIFVLFHFAIHEYAVLLFFLRIFENHNKLQFFCTYCNFFHCWKRFLSKQEMCKSALYMDIKNFHFDSSAPINSYSLRVKSWLCCLRLCIWRV